MSYGINEATGRRKDNTKVNSDGYAVLHTQEVTGSSPVVSTKNHRNHLIPVIFFRNPQLFEVLNFWRFFKTHTLTHTGKGTERIRQHRMGAIKDSFSFLFVMIGMKSYFM